jgi:hypothetical protein
VGSAGELSMFDRPLAAEVNPNFSFCSKWLTFLLDESSALPSKSHMKQKKKESVH